MANADIDLEKWKPMTEHPKIGELLLQHKKITIIQLGIALEEQKKNKIPIGQLLINMNIITPDELTEVLEIQSTIDKMIVEDYDVMEKLKNE